MPHPLDHPEPAALPRRFRTLTPAQLDLAEVSVRKRMCRAFLALGVHDKAGAIRAAHEAGILDLTGGGS